MLSLSISYGSVNFHANVAAWQFPCFGLQALLGKQGQQRCRALWRQQSNRLSRSQCVSQTQCHLQRRQARQFARHTFVQAARGRKRRRIGWRQFMHADIGACTAAKTL